MLLRRILQDQGHRGTSLAHGEKESLTAVFEVLDMQACSVNIPSISAFKTGQAEEVPEKLGSEGLEAVRAVQPA